jgi:hypothetical protein
MVRTLYGMLADYQASSAMPATTSSYSKDARAMQEKHNISFPCATMRMSRHGYRGMGTENIKRKRRCWSAGRRL